MTAPAPEIMSPEQLWALAGDEEIEQYRGETVELTPFDHKLAKDFEIFSKVIGKDRDIDNHVVVHDGTHTEEDDDDAEFFDIVQITRD